MVSSMRQALKRPLFRDIVVWSAVLSLSLAYTLPELIRRFSSPDGVITVNSSVITGEEFQAEVNTQQRKISSLYSQYGKNAKFILEYSGLSSDPTTMAYNILVRQELINSIAKRYNIKIDKVLLDEQLINLLPQGAVSEDGTLNIPRDLIEDIRRSLKNEIIGKMVLDIVGAGSYIPEFEIKSAFIEKYSKRSYSILTFSFENYLKTAKDKKVSDKELLAYYGKNKSKYFVEEKRDGKVWQFDADKYGIQIKDAEVKSYYSKNKPKYKDKPAEVKVAKIVINHSPEAEKKAADLHKELLKDVSKFAQLAKEHSDDKASAVNGGELEFFKRGDKDPEIESVAFVLNKENPLAEVVKTKDGYEIIKFVAKKQATFKPLKDVEKDIKDTIKAERFKKVFPANMQKIMHSSNKNADLIKFKEKGSQGITYSKMPKGESKEIKKLFRIKAKGDFNYLVDGNRGVIVQLDNIHPAHTPPLKEIKDKVEADYYHNQATTKLKSDVDKAKKEAATKPLGKLKDKFKASERDVKDISPEDKTVLSTLAGQGVPAYKMINLQLEGALLSEATEKDGFLVKLTKLNSFDKKLFEDKKAEIKKELEQSRSQILSEGFIASLKKDAKISIKDDRLKNQLKDLL
jgi:hypothetical protein